MRHFHSSPGNSCAQYGWNTGCVKPSMLDMSDCSVSKYGRQLQPRGWMSSSPAPSRNPHVCTVLGIMAATASMLFIAPMAPALQPPKSRRCPGVAPRPWFCISPFITAVTMRLPRNV